MTYAQFCHVSKAVGPPPRPRDDVDLSNVDFVDLATAENLVSDNLTLFPTTPSPEMLGIERDPLWREKKIYNGGEREALKYYVKRIEHEKTAFLEGTFMGFKFPNLTTFISLMPHDRMHQVCVQI